MFAEGSSQSQCLIPKQNSKAETARRGFRGQILKQEEGPHAARPVAQLRSRDSCGRGYVTEGKY